MGTVGLYVDTTREKKNLEEFFEACGLSSTYEGSMERPRLGVPDTDSLVRGGGDELLHVGA